MAAVLLIRTLTFLHLLSHCTSLSQDGLLLLQIRKADWKDIWSPLSDWNESDQNPCAWRGISCNAFNSVTSVDLRGLSISGNVTSTLCRLSNLTALTLQRNAFSGPFPRGLLHCKRLQKLDLGSNQFAGTLPDRISELRELRVLNLAHNTFSGNIPEAQELLMKIEALFFHKNSFNGPLPVFLGNLKSLKHLSFGNNPLSPGVIPTELGNLKQLQQLRLQNSSLVGGIPTFLGNLTQLELLDISRNQLLGAIPPELGHLTLSVFNVSHNNLSGRIPDALDIPAYKDGFLGNPKLCGGHNLMLPPCSSPPNLLPKRLAIILLPPILVAALTLCGCYGLRRRQAGDDLHNTLENLSKVASIFVPTAITLLLTASKTASEIRNKGQGVATNDKTIAFRIFLLGDIAAIIASMIVALKLGMRSSDTNGLAWFGMVGLCSTVVFFIFSFFALLYLMMMSDKYRF